MSKLLLIARILAVAAILFVSLFALDAFGHGEPFWTEIGHFFLHLIPSFILLIFLLISYKWELLSGVLFLAVGMVATPWVYTHNYAMNNSVWMSIGIVCMLTLPFIIIGTLFIIYGVRKRKGIVK